MHFHAALPIHHNERLCYITFKYQLTIYKKRKKYSWCRHRALATRKATLFILRKSVHPLHMLFPEEILMLLMLFKSNTANRSSWIGNVFESLVSLLVTKYKPTSLLQNSHFINHSCIS